MTDMKHILVTGANGQLGESFKHIHKKLFPFRYTFIDIKDVDLTHEASVRQFFDNSQFDYVINCAAYTNVDQAEQNPEETFAINAGVPKLLGEISIQKSFRLIHISTDYIFSGNASIPYKETSKPCPLSSYGKSKLEGEMALYNNANAILIRSAWLYSEYGTNFLKTMLRLGNEKKELGVVSDQIGSPTYAADLASVILYIIKTSEQNKFMPGIYHYANEGICSWFDFAREIMNITGLPCKVIPIGTAEYPLPAKRPAYSVLDTSKIKKAYRLDIPHWKASMKIALDRIAKK